MNFSLRSPLCVCLLLSSTLGTSPFAAPRVRAQPPARRAPAAHAPARSPAPGRAGAAGRAPGAAAAETENVVRLQIFLDSENFGPGKIDGRYGGFTKFAWHRWQAAHSAAPPNDQFDPATPPLAQVNPVFVDYTLTAADLANVGPVPAALAEQQKAKVLPYASLSELLGERAHTDVEFLKRLNAPRNLDRLRAGDTVKLPNVPDPFDMTFVRQERDLEKVRAEKIRAGLRNKPRPGPVPPSPPFAPTPPGPAAGAGANPPRAAAAAATPATPAEAASATTVVKRLEESEQAPPPPAPAGADPAVPGSVAGGSGPPGPGTGAGAGDEAGGAPEPAALKALPAQAYLHVSVKDRYLELRDGDRVLAGFPVTPGSTTLPSPVGEWKIVAKTLLPTFRWDKAMLLHGHRSAEAYQLPPGPNNPVGIAWIALSKDGIGLHGTSSPDTIGRSASHGCIRLANWDVIKLYNLVPRGLKVVIE